MRNALLLFAILVMTACSKDDEKTDYTAENDAEIKAYLASNNLIAKSTGSGLYYMIETEGTGDQPGSRDNVTVAYKGYYANRVVFDESNSSGISFNLQGVIEGWTEGIPYFKEGGRGQLFIPSHLGYGSQDSRGIPGGSVLIFDIHLIQIN
ncbi:MAG: FKBP-type peptidyl-prolyl cis-trans isomerase FkpA [Vicingaceae bacterium]|jgi:FKBP-type peptidyl-prolyl cis-trans isomerase FkpA